MPAEDRSFITASSDARSLLKQVIIEKTKIFPLTINHVKNFQGILDHPACFLTLNTKWAMDSFNSSATYFEDGF